MDRIFISELKIEHVRHLRDIRIFLSEDKRKHLILTGRNGSGKTSVLEALARNLEGKVLADREQEIEELKQIQYYENLLCELQDRGEKSNRTIEVENVLKSMKQARADITAGVSMEFMLMPENICLTKCITDEIGRASCRERV